MDRIHIIFFSVSIGITYIGMGCRVPKNFSENYVDRVHIIFFSVSIGITFISETPK